MFVDNLYLTMTTENRAESILRYLKFIVISGDARTQKIVMGFSKRIFAAAQLGHLLYACSTIFFQEH